MKPEIAFSHVALLVPSVRQSAAIIQNLGFACSSPETYPGQGTSEIYVEQPRGGSLLLIEAIKPGVYQTALQKRGPGLHHVAVDVQSLKLFLELATHSGWTLHAASAETINKNKTAFLYSEGFPGLIEVHETETPNTQELFIDQLFLPIQFKTCGNLKVLGLDSLITYSETPKLSLHKKIIEIKDLFATFPPAEEAGDVNN